jgi:hypothetical protein
MAHRYSLKQFANTLYAVLGSDKRFDDIEGTERRGRYIIVAYPFDGTAICITIRPDGASKERELKQLLHRYAREADTNRRLAVRHLLADLRSLANRHGLELP